MTTKVSLGFGKLPDTELDNFAPGVIDALTGSDANSEEILHIHRWYN